jgi:hypothetical protein
MRRIFVVMALIGVALVLSVGKADAACEMPNPAKIVSITPYAPDNSIYLATVVDSTGRKWFGSMQTSHPYFNALLTAMGDGLTVRLQGTVPTCNPAGGNVGTITRIQFTK